MLLAWGPVSGITEAAFGHGQAQAIAASATQASIALHGVQANGRPLHLGISYLDIRGRAVVPSGWQPNLTQPFATGRAGAISKAVAIAKVTQAYVVISHLPLSLTNLQFTPHFAAIEQVDEAGAHMHGVFTMLVVGADTEHGAHGHYRDDAVPLPLTLARGNACVIHQRYADGAAALCFDLQPEMALRLLFPVPDMQRTAPLRIGYKLLFGLLC
ncbi:hypothetical protein [Stutzerimonas kunmingensis]|uniref:hypothetical protein n=1 Tax=Stutzerimonas kunmingensis TaxID=1211807 RepID=UPI0028A6D9F5|nr:hypothetical protein [Stutzerimonas kunmingensis]